MATEDCPLAELWVTQRLPNAQGGPDDYVLEAASAYSIGGPVTDFRYTNGAMAVETVIETRGGIISFGAAGLCWCLAVTWPLHDRLHVH